MEQKKNSLELKQYKALLFDFDGTLFDTADANYQAYYQAYADLGVEITREMFKRTKGLSVYQFNEAMGVSCNVELLRSLKQKYYSKIALSSSPNQYLLGVLKSTKLLTALVTTARRENIRSLLRRYDIDFNVYITQDSVNNHKPDPECYYQTIRRLGVSPSDCLAFEDSDAGVKAAKLAGVDCIQIDGFHEDCLKKLGGGSGCETKVVFEENSLVVYKMAKNIEQIERLTAQYRFLEKEYENDLFVKAEIAEKNDMLIKCYRMPYVFGENLHRSNERLLNFYRLMGGVLNNSGVLKDVDDFFKSNNNFDDKREVLKTTYLDSGARIYREIVGDELKIPFHRANDIPVFVNNFRITPYHGDTIFDNTIVNSGKITLIDPVPDRNPIQGVAHDFSKIGQSLMGYEAIRDGESFDYTNEKAVFNIIAREFLTFHEFLSLKFYTACLFLRRLKHQQYDDPRLVKPYGKIAERLLQEFADENYKW